MEINNLQDIRFEKMTKEDLWKGLLLRARRPELFLLHMESCRVEDIADNELARELFFGKFTVQDRVTLAPDESLNIFIPAQNEIPESTLVITIEEPSPLHFFLRFSYEDTAPDEGAEAMYNDFRRSAYREADIDFIRIVRQLAAQKQLDKHLNEPTH